MIQWAKYVYDWAREDTRFVGISPWHWEGGINTHPVNFPYEVCIYLVRGLYN
jgi:hypothetical protein